MRGQHGYDGIGLLDHHHRIFHGIHRGRMDVGTIGGETMNAFVWIGLLVGAALFIYLLAFLINPERFL